MLGLDKGLKALPVQARLEVRSSWEDREEANIRRMKYQDDGWCIHFSTNIWDFGRQ